MEAHREHECETHTHPHAPHPPPLSLPSFEETGLPVTAYNLMSSGKGWDFKKFEVKRNQLWQRGPEAVDTELKSKGWTVR